MSKLNSTQWCVRSAGKFPPNTIFSVSTPTQTTQLKPPILPLQCRPVIKHVLHNRTTRLKTIASKKSSRHKINTVMSPGNQREQEQHQDNSPPPQEEERDSVTTPGNGTTSDDDDTDDEDDVNEFSGWRVHPRLTPRKDSALQVRVEEVEHTNSCYTSYSRMGGLACDAQSTRLHLTRVIHLQPSLEATNETRFSSTVRTGGTKTLLYSVGKLKITFPSVRVVTGNQYRVGVLHVSPLHRR